MAEAAWELNKSFPILCVEKFGGAVLIFAFSSNSLAEEGKIGGALNKFSPKLIEGDRGGGGGGLLLSKKSSILGKLDGHLLVQVQKDLNY